MRKTLFALSTLFLLPSALALPGETRAVARLHAKPDAGSAVLLTLKADTPLDIRTCTAGLKGWCQVTAQKKTGYVPRSQVYGKGNCAELIAVGLRDLQPGEASYNKSRDRDGDGKGCDKVP
ncbi:hypothetical protein F8S09_00120 [Deinococcus sp. SDU3-2]|uniref:Excalibur calcium-binding domain-containing protein n=1 Tax=Deinococcus terrestris TaxID=2651870 RepID=A0A7X1NSV4_9DEIO|nr:SH3 domain-containing protein [Deinococcus terrestris]MPY65102.1 hypothetical protein [Deinococcus terrestris]